MNNIKIIIADDHKEFRSALKLILSKVDGIKVISEVSNGKELLDKLKTIFPDVILMDIQMDEMNGINATERVFELYYPNIKVIALTMFGDFDHLKSMIIAGAQGFLLKNTSKSELENAIKKVYNGEYYYSPSIKMDKIITKKKTL